MNSESETEHDHNDCGGRLFLCRKSDYSVIHSEKEKH